MQQIAEHEVWPADVQQSAALDSFHRLNVAVNPWKHSADSAALVEHRSVDGDGRAHLGDTVPFENANAELFHPKPAHGLL